MITSFRSLFTVAVAHTYYSERCRDFSFVIPMDTAAQLAGAKLLAREVDGVLHILYETEPGGGALVPVDGRRLRFGLRLRNPLFSNFTALAFDPASEIPLYRNLADPTTLDAALAVQPAGDRFSIPLHSASRPVTVTLADAAGTTLKTETLTADADCTAISYDLLGQPPGLVTAEEAYPADTVSTSWYRDDNLLAMGVFGVVEIIIHNGFYANAPAFTVSFTAKEEPLEYYVVAKNYSTTEFNQLTVADAGFSEESRPRVDFTRIESSAFTDAEIPSALIAPSGARIALFRSTAVPRRDKGRRKIQLLRHHDVLITHLPQPGAEKARGELIVQLSKP